MRIQFDKTIRCRRWNRRIHVVACGRRVKSSQKKKLKKPTAQSICRSVKSLDPRDRKKCRGRDFSVDSRKRGDRAKVKIVLKRWLRYASMGEKVK